jgi:hypothetical protein
MKNEEFSDATLTLIKGCLVCQLASYFIHARLHLRLNGGRCSRYS